MAGRRRAAGDRNAARRSRAAALHRGCANSDPQRRSRSRAAACAPHCPQVVAAGDALGLDVRLAAAVNFKNLVKYRWVSLACGTGA